MISKCRNAVSKVETNYVQMSPLYPYMQKMIEQSNKQFWDPAQQILKTLQANLAKAKEAAEGKANKDGTQLNNRQLLALAESSVDSKDSKNKKKAGAKTIQFADDLERTKSNKKYENASLDILKSKEHLVGVLINKQTV